MNGKRGAAKGVKLAKHKANANAYEKLPENPTAEQLKNAAVNISLNDLEERVADVRDSWETDSLFEDAFEELANGAAVTAGGKFFSFSFPSFAVSGRWCKVCGERNASAFGAVLLFHPPVMDAPSNH